MTAVAPPRQKRGGYFIPLLMVVAVVIAITNVFPFRQIIAQNRQVEQAQVELAEVQAENERLTREVAALQTDSEIERIAREDYGYVRPGDTSYVIVEPPTLPGAAEPAVVAEPEIESGGIFDAIWDYLTGRDLTDE